MDITPTQIIHLTLLGKKEEILNSKAIWLCLSCYTCTTRCPQGVDIAKVIEESKILSRREKVKPSLKEISIFHQSFLQVIERCGRVYELGLIGLLKIRTLNFIQDIDVGIKMLKKRKLRIIPSLVNSKETKRIFFEVRKIEKTIGGGENVRTKGLGGTKNRN